jgi:energy-coupling factor transporter ATP-binding protein EcfA2
VEDELVSDARSGLERVRLDLHVHTPASHDWQGGEVTPEHFVERCLGAGLDGIAVTDHQSGAWIDRLKKAAEGTALTVLPGVEVSNLGGAEGVHLNVLFPCDTRSDDIERFLAAIGAVSGTGERLERGTAHRGINEVLDEVLRFGGIAVIAHSRSSKGALADMRGAVRTAVVRHPAVLAVEANAEDYFDQQKQDQHRRVYDFLDGSDPNYRRKLAVYQASDNPAPAGHGHTLDGIGERFTYFYVERPIDLETLRQCLIDRESRIVMPDPQDVGAGEAAGAPHIERLRVIGGFLDGLDLPLHAGLTTLIGSKGSGKSLVVELLRFVLNQAPTQPELLRDHEAKLAIRLGVYGRVIVTVRDSSGSAFDIERTYDPANGSPYTDTPFDVAEFFPCLFLSQGEIVRLAESEAEQIRFIDTFFDFRAHQREIEQVSTDLRELDQLVAEQIKARRRMAPLTKEWETLRKQIEEKDKQLVSPAFGRFQDAQRKSQQLAAVAASVDTQRDIAGDALAAFDAAARPPEAAGALERDPAVLRVASHADDGREAARVKLAEAVEALDAVRAVISAEIDAWDKEFTKVESEYNETIRAAGGDAPALNQDRARLVGRAEQVAGRLRAVEQRAAQLGPTVERRRELLAKLTAAQQAYTNARKQRCAWFEEKSNGQIAANVAERADFGEFQARLDELKRGSYLTAPEIESIAGSIAPHDFVAALLRYNLTRRDDDLRAITDASKLGLDRIRTLAEFLLSDEKYEELLALEYAAVPTDRPQIAFRVESGELVQLKRLSTGQKCTALLIMALCEGNIPIVVDQPEDSLDIRSIWEDMCVRLRDTKRVRQFVFTTHNSSLSVASDSDKFVVLAADGEQGGIAHAGAIDGDEMREHVITLLEGGKATYFLKQRKYGIVDPYAAARDDGRPA